MGTGLWEAVSAVVRVALHVSDRELGPRALQGERSAAKPSWQPQSQQMTHAIVAPADVTNKVGLPSKSASPSASPNKHRQRHK